MDLCFLCIKEYNCVLADERIVSQVEYLLPEITIIKLGIPLRICFVCDGALCAFSKFKHSSVESSRRLEAHIKGAQGPPLHTGSPPVVDDSATLAVKPEKAEVISIKEEYVEETPLDTQMQPLRTSVNPIGLVETIIAETHNQLHKDRMSQNNQLHTDTNTHNIEEIFIKEEQIEEVQQVKEYYSNILKEECLSNSTNDDTYRKPEHNTEDESATLNSNEEDWEGSSADSDEETVEETDGNFSKNIQTNLKQHKIKSFSRKAYFTNHKNMHSGINDIQCKICDKSFTSKFNLIRHMNIHSGVKDFQCESCEKLFTRNSDLIRHMKIHSGIKEFQCEICEKLFTRNSDLIRHIKKHSGVKEFQCDICDKSFTGKNNLTSHMRIHSEEKRFQCKICNKLYRFRSSLNYHMKLHSGIKDFQCEICAKSFTLKGSLISHMKSHSKIKEVR